MRNNDGDRVRTKAENAGSNSREPPWNLMPLRTPSPGPGLPPSNGGLTGVLGRSVVDIVRWLRFASPLVLLVTLAAPVSAAPAFDLDRATIPDLQQRMDRGRLTAAGLTELYLTRIRALDGKINSVMLLDPTARDQAKASDRRRRDGKLRGPLDGIPVLLKDNIDTARLQTTAGSRALLGTPPAKDAFLVQRLRGAGAVILGRQISPNGRTSGPRNPLPGGPESVARPTIRMSWTAIRVVLRPDPVPRWRLRWRRSRSARRPMVRSCARPDTGPLGSQTDAPGSSAGQASCRFPPNRTPRAR